MTLEMTLGTGVSTCMLGVWSHELHRLCLYGTKKGIGKFVGGLAGGVAGGAGMKVGHGGTLLDLLSPTAATAETEPAMIPMTQSPNADTYSAIRAAQRATLRRNLAPSGTVGSAAQESGWSPSVTQVPIRPTPSSPLTPESVPGPDTAGKGNLLGT